MNNSNLLYALLGGGIVASAWVATTVTMQSLLVGLSVYATAAALFVAVQDYHDSSKSLR